MNKSNRSFKKENSYDRENDMECSYFKQGQCMFCSNIDVLRCVCISVMRKHNDEDNFEVKLIESILNEDSESSILKKFIGVIDSLDGQRLSQCFQKSESLMKMDTLLQFYKFRRFVPRFAHNTQSSIAQNYYYQRLKLYYNQIKRKLNITIDPSSSQAELTGSSNLSLSTMRLVNNLDREDNVLEQLTKTIELVEQTTGPTLQHNCQTQSKALQDLVWFLKSYPKIEGGDTFHHQTLKLAQKTSKEIFKDFLQKNKSKTTINNHYKNKIFVTFFSKPNPNHKATRLNPPKPLKIQNTSKIKVKSKQNTKNTQISIKFQKIKQGILNQRYKDVKTKIHQQKRTTPTKVKTSRNNDQADNQNPQSYNKKLVIFNGTQNKTPNIKGQVRSLSKLKPKRASSESKLKPTRIEPIPNKSMKDFVKGQKILLQNQSSGKKQTDQIQNQQLQSRRKSLDLTKLKQFLKDNENKKLQQNEKNSDYSSQSYENLVFDTPRRLIKTTNVTPATSSRKQKDESNQIILQKSDNIVSMKKKKLELLKRNMQKEKTEGK